MPNWCEGTFRARGNIENIKKFIIEGLGPVERDSLKVFEVEGDNDVAMDFEIETKYGLVWIKETHRHFFDFSEWNFITLYWINMLSREVQIIVPFKAAWDIRETDISKISKMYGIAIKVNGFERGVRFERSVETTASGTVKEDIVRKYDDWDWDCPMPLLGG